jgi:hypothetical protein
MKRISLVLGILVVLVSCSKEYSLENGTGDTDLIVGVDCRISKVTSTDTTTNIGLGSIAADINSSDEVTDITAYDSLSATIVTNSQPTYVDDTIYVNPDEYFVTDVANNARVVKLHRLLDPFDPTSPQIDIDYIYDATTGNLLQKQYNSSFFPVNPFYQVDYTYTAGNLTNMLTTDLTIPETVSDAQIQYFSNITPRSYINLMPDEEDPNYAQFNQFFNFGKKSLNAVKSVKLRNYSGGALTSDSTNTVFGSYIMSRDNYVLSVIMSGDELLSIPAQKGRLRFSYKCK